MWSAAAMSRQRDGPSNLGWNGFMIEGNVQALTKFVSNLNQVSAR